MITPECRLEMRAQKIERIRAARTIYGPPGIGLTLEQQTAYAVLVLVAAEQARDEGAAPDLLRTEPSAAGMMRS